MNLNTVNVLYSQMLRENEERPRKQRHYPSSACAIVDGKFYGKCRRATWYEWKGVPRTDHIDAPGLFKMQVGDIIHEHLSAILNRALADLGYSTEDCNKEGFGEEVAMVWQSKDLKYPVSGRLDKRVIAPDGTKIAIEWKSTYGRGADYIKRDGPKDENLMQCTLYLEQDVLPVDAVALMYATRDSGYFMGYWVTKNEGGLKIEYMGSTKTTFSKIGWDSVLAGTLSLEEALEKDTPPAMDYDGTWNCDYCGHTKICKGKI